MTVSPDPSSPGPSSPPVLIRPMAPSDVPVAERISDEAFLAADLLTVPRGAPDPTPRPAERSERWIARTRSFLDTDPQGCVVAETLEGPDAGAVIGFATSMVRERLWVLATFAVLPGAQGLGLGSRLLAAAEQSGRAAGCDRAMLSASDDPRALRRYWGAGFRLHGQRLLSGVLDRSALPAVTGLREGTEADRDLLDTLDRERRGAGHGPDHVALAAQGALVVDAAGDGYAYAAASGPALVAARDEGTARRLLWECLARTEPGADVEVGHVSGANDWAVDVALTARLTLRHDGWLGTRGMDAPTTYLHHGALL
ncbi:GNAT family N-acetyltransferase [Nocardioides bruguierae]|uniref:GNAT family N-acetyltransferase n=1 Tax=Nocardioides bruguierae TaxID=2945102 RepID=A0A9X2DAU2_9ACTN|nr:N-acetyltransferase [Nocardioides bruguierae]MCM0622204.1 GNAT family N-acetyltransferase [Nocardioides bruguierae]